MEVIFWLQLRIKHRYYILQIQIQWRIKLFFMSWVKGLKIDQQLPFQELFKNTVIFFQNKT